MARHDMGGPIPENLDLSASCTLQGIALRLIRIKVKAVAMIDRDTQALPVVAYQVNPKGSRFSFVSFHGLFGLTTDSRNVHWIHVRTNRTLLEVHDGTITAFLATLQHSYILRDNPGMPCTDWQERFRCGKRRGPWGEHCRFDVYG